MFYNHRVGVAHHAEDHVVALYDLGIRLVVPYVQLSNKERTLTFVEEVVSCLRIVADYRVNDVLLAPNSIDVEVICAILSMVYNLRLVQPSPGGISCGLIMTATLAAVPNMCLDY